MKLKVLFFIFFSISAHSAVVSYEEQGDLQKTPLVNIQTNLLHDLGGSFNLTAEFPVHPRVSLGPSLFSVNARKLNQSRLGFFGKNEKLFEQNNYEGVGVGVQLNYHVNRDLTQDSLFVGVAPYLASMDYFSVRQGQTFKATQMSWMVKTLVGYRWVAASGINFTLGGSLLYSGALSSMNLKSQSGEEILADFPDFGLIPSMEVTLGFAL
ncbi:MAG: hypothetical protein CL678_18315 [Bdellovibrionaceae bacterium]|nr:hypothetical protein [Pseudobdellovibrionaceae bacterium]|tara:strand:+ start:952 stop:1581 length:630 start_codon:yes stop_codon:yes gene_type:complete